MPINKKSFLQRIKQGIIKKTQPVGNIVGTVKSNVKANVNIIKLASRHSILPGTFGRKNYNTVINKGKAFAKRGDMVGLRNYFKSQQKKAKNQ